MTEAKHNPRVPLWRRLVFGGAVVLAAASAYVWFFDPFPVAVPEDSGHLPRLDDTDDPAFVHWVHRDQDLYEATDEDPDQEPDPPYTETDMAGAELIACGEAVQGERVNLCSYSALGDDEDTTLDSYAVRFDFTVYEAATHERVGETSVDYAGPGDGCPMDIEGAVSKILSEPAPQDIELALIEFADRHDWDGETP